jgi:hypothetical protein
MQDFCRHPTPTADLCQPFAIFTQKWLVSGLTAGAAR